MTEPEEVLVIQTLQIVDKNSAAKKNSNNVNKIKAIDDEYNRYERVEDNLIR